MEVWNRATGRVREGYGLAVHRCKRCAGYHVSLRPVDRIPSRPQPTAPADTECDEPQSWDDWCDEASLVRRVSLSDAAWS
jgi:hypothetical protein